MSEIAAYLGHTSINVTFRVYAKYSPDYLRKAGDVIAQCLSDEPEKSQQTKG